MALNIKNCLEKDSFLESVSAGGSLLTLEHVEDLRIVNAYRKKKKKDVSEEHSVNQGRYQRY